MQHTLQHKKPYVNTLFGLNVTNLSADIQHSINSGNGKKLVEKVLSSLLRIDFYTLH